MGENDASRLAGGAGSEENFRDSGTRRSVPRIWLCILRLPRTSDDVMEIVYHQGRRCAKIGLRAVPENQLYVGFLHGPADKLEIGAGIHRHGDSTAEKNGPE